MKSVIQESSSLSKAIEQGWIKAGKPREFTIKIFQEAKKNFFGFTTLPAKVGIFFKEVDNKETYHKPQQRPQQQPYRHPQQQSQVQPKRRFHKDSNSTSNNNNNATRPTNQQPHKEFVRDNRPKPTRQPDRPINSPVKPSVKKEE